MAEVEFRKVDVVFGPDPGRALKLLDEGATREAILEQTGHVLGVADATIAIEPGEICVLMGLSGSGKSTLLRCVNYLETPSAGELMINGKPAVAVAAKPTRSELTALRRQVGMVFQGFNLFPHLNVLTNIALPQQRVLGRSKAEAEERAMLEKHNKFRGKDE